ncbi:DUF1403 family protein [Roseovarius sp. S4756]|uniref:DUF1403 family protein n=1 Tax=Roseovarius maritimus TaxID=3342637 RepID=UPI0037283EB9
MKSERIIHGPSLNTLPLMPAWVTSARGETLEDVAFLSGAALSHLHLVLGGDDAPQALLRERLALRAAETCVAHSGRVERAGELRDALAFLQPGDQPGPAGGTYLSWRRAVERPVSVKALHRALPNLEPDQIATWLNGCDPRDGCGRRGAGQGTPVFRAAFVLKAVLDDNPRAHTTAMIFADAALAQSLGWSHILPFLTLGLKRRDLHSPGEELRMACHRAIVSAASEVDREVVDLARRAARLQDVTSKLRAKGAEEAVKMFLTRDTVAPTSLTSLRSDRAARRFCDRLVELGAVRELTGRETFRLYGV